MSNLDQQDIIVPHIAVSAGSAERQLHLLPEAPDAGCRQRDDAAQPVCSWTWVPVRSMTARHRPQILRHLLTSNRTTAICASATRPPTRRSSRYVERLDFDRDELFGIFNRRSN